VYCLTVDGSLITDAVSPAALLPLPDVYTYQRTAFKSDLIRILEYTYVIHSIACTQLKHTQLCLSPRAKITTTSWSKFSYEYPLHKITKCICQQHTTYNTTLIEHTVFSIIIDSYKCLIHMLTPIGATFSTNFKSWLFAVPGSPSNSILMSPRLVSPSGSRLREPPNNKQAIARFMSKKSQRICNPIQQTISHLCYHIWKVLYYQQICCKYQVVQLVVASRLLHLEIVTHSHRLCYDLLFPLVFPPLSGKADEYPHWFSHGLPSIHIQVFRIHRFVVCV